MMLDPRCTPLSDPSGAGDLDGDFRDVFRDVFRDFLGFPLNNPKHRNLFEASLKSRS